jgi:hypothetical protein
MGVRKIDTRCPLSLRRPGTPRRYAATHARSRNGKNGRKRSRYATLETIGRRSYAVCSADLPAAVGEPCAAHRRVLQGRRLLKNLGTNILMIFHEILAFLFAVSQAE